jgi:hypothetical protein
MLQFIDFEPKNRGEGCHALYVEHVHDGDCCSAAGELLACVNGRAPCVGKLGSR